LDTEKIYLNSEQLEEKRGRRGFAIGEGGGRKGRRLKKGGRGEKYKRVFVLLSVAHVYISIYLYRLLIQYCTFTSIAQYMSVYCV
jgi:hypothetical protein